MEKWQREYIIKSLPELVQMTRFSTVVQASLESEGILSKDDISSLEATKRSEGVFKQSAHLYDLLPGREFAYEKLTKALFVTNQSGAAKILLEGLTKHGIRTSLTHCGIHIEHDEFENTDILAYGKRFKLKTYFPNVDTGIIQNIFYEALPEHIYYESFIRKKKFELLKDTIPPEPAFYVPRFISNRIKINKDLFQCKCPDVFVFKGIERYKLSELAKPNYTASSRDQLECITSRFIYLDREEDWETIRDTATAPVHLITYESNQISSAVISKKDSSTSFLDEDKDLFIFYSDEDEDFFNFSSDEDEADSLFLDQEEDTLVPHNNLESIFSDDSFVLENTCGNSKVLSGYCSDQDRAYITEEEFVERLLSKETMSSGACICDSPGMGKTLLLANVARIFVQRCPENITAFIKLSDFMQNKALPNIDRQPSEALLYLFQHINFSISLTENAEVIRALVEKSYGKICLFFDGFDEINSKEVEWMKKLFNLLKTSFHSIDMYVTSRPHMRQDLESSLKVVAYDIRSFNLENQVNFLVNSWTQEFPKSIQSLLKTYALAVLKMLKDTLSDDEKGIAGIPLLCGLIASVYAKEAKLYASSDATPQEIRCPSRSICEMYKAFIETKIDRTINDMFPSKEAVDQSRIIDAKDLKHFHVLQAWKLLFPEMDTIEKLEDFQNSDFDDIVIYKVGIMQQRSSGNTMKMEFVHRTFAEYLIAEYFAEYLLSSKFSNPKFDFLLGFLLKNFLKSKYKSWDSLHYRIVNDFLHNVIVYFLNSLLSPQIPFRVTENQIEIVCKSLSAKSLLDVLRICCFHSYPNIFCLLKNVLLSCHLNVQHVYNEYFTKEKCFDIVNSAVRYTNLHFVKECFQLASEVFNYDLVEICQMRSEEGYVRSLLQMAVWSANYETVEFLIDKTDYKNQNLLRLCLESSYYGTFKHNRLPVLQLLLKKDKHLIDESPDILMATKMCIEYFIALVKYGAPLEATNLAELDERNANCVMFAATYMSPSDFHRLLEFLISDCQAQHWFYSNARRNMTLPFVIRRGGLLSKSLDMLLNIPGVDLNMVDKDGNNLAHNAVHGTNLPLLEILIQRGTNYKCTGQHQRSLLHTAAAKASDEIITLLVSLGLDPNQCDEDGETPILIAARLSQLQSVMKLVERGADRFVSNNRGRNMLHMAAKNGNLDLISYCVDLGFNIDLKDNEENSSIILAAFHSNLKTVKLLVKLGANFNTTSRDGANILHIAAEKDNIQLVRYCIRLGMDPNRGTKLGNTPIMLAIMWNTEKIKMVRTLIDLGADINVTNNEGLNMLHYAAGYGDENLIRLCIELGLDPNPQTNKGYSPIMLAVLHENLILIPALIEAGADCNLVNNFGRNILHLAAGTQDLNIVEYCLHVGLNINQPDYQGNTPLLLAASYNDLPTVSYLIDKGADYNQCNYSGQDITFYSILSENLQMLQYLQDVGWDPNQTNIYGESRLFTFAGEGWLAKFKLLVQIGADHKTVNYSGETLLHTAARTNHVELLCYLLSEGLPVNHQDNNGNSPILLASLFGDVQSVWTLMESGADYKLANKKGLNIFHNAVRRANKKLILFCMYIGMDPNQGDVYGNTPFLLASHSCSSNLMRQMNKCGADPKTVNNEGQNILHIAARGGNFQLIDGCIELGLDPNLCDKNGDPPIFLAVEYADITTVLNLMYHGAELYTTKSKGQTILHIAAERGNERLVNFCLCHGLNPNQKDNDGDTPLFLAAECGDVDTVHMLITYGADYNSKNSYGQNIVDVAADWLNDNLVSYCVNVLFVGQDKPDITPFQILQTGFRLPKGKKLRAVLKCQ